VSTIPNNLHFIWVGGAIPREHAATLLEWATGNPDYACHLWTENKNIEEYVEIIIEEFKFQEQRIDKIFKAINLEGVELTLATYSDEVTIQISAISGIPALSDVTLLYEEIYTWKNYGAASDILRLWILHQYGGIYMDLDTFPKNHALPTNINAPKNILFGYMQYFTLITLCNHIIASDKQNNQLIDLSRKVALAYGESFSEPIKGVRSIPQKQKDLYDEVDTIRQDRSRRAMSPPDDPMAMLPLKMLLGNLTISRSGPGKIREWIAEQEGTNVDTGNKLAFKYGGGEELSDGTEFDQEVFDLYSFQKQTKYWPRCESQSSWVK